MYLNDLQRTDFLHTTIGLDAKQFDKHVIRKTNQSSEHYITLDVDNPAFFLNYLILVLKQIKI
jgi:magnesium-protoporphyrin IX monomethyl ester (oxidative) cyclase